MVTYHLGTLVPSGHTDSSPQTMPAAGEVTAATRDHVRLVTFHTNDPTPSCHFMHPLFCFGSLLPMPEEAATGKPYHDAKAAAWHS